MRPAPELRPRLRSRRALLAVALLATASLALACGGACGGSSGAATAGGRRPNLLLISLDSTRRDLLSAYGHRAPHAPDVPSSPRLDRLAAEGVLMEDAYATTSWTLPSHVSILTGQPEVVHAVDAMHLRTGMPFLAEVLKGNGYRTAGFYSGPFLDGEFGFERGFDVYRACYGDELQRASASAEEAQERLARAERSGDAAAIAAARQAGYEAQHEQELLSHRDVSSPNVTDATIAELERAAEDGRPFFVFAHYFDPHYDYTPPAPYDERFDPDYAGDLDARDFISNPEIAGVDTSEFGQRTRVIGDRDLEHVRALYAGEMAWTDEQVGRVLDALDRLGLAHDTLVVVTADHGDEFFEHDGLGHRRTLFEEVVQVPLILRMPERLPAGARVSGLVSTIDILPTALQVLGLPPLEGLASKSFLPMIVGREDGGERSVLGRILVTFNVTLAVPEDPAAGRVRGELCTLRESFRKAAIKVRRERTWIRSVDTTSAETREALAQQSRDMFADEILLWIDLEEHPGEEEEHWSDDFADPRAWDALRAFQDRYARLLGMRGQALRQEATPSVVGALRGLGYVGEGEGAPSSSSSEFTLPPPGLELLRRAR